MAIGSHHSARSQTDEWLTPPEILGELGPFDLDPCAPLTRPWGTAAKRLPRFNYISTADREDMLAVLEAFIAKNRRDGSILDRINNPPASQMKQ